MQAHHLTLDLGAAPESEVALTLGAEPGSLIYFTTLFRTLLYAGLELRDTIIMWSKGSKSAIQQMLQC